MHTCTHPVAPEAGREKKDHFVEAPKAQAVDGQLLAQRQRWRELQRVWPLQHTQRHRHNCCICIKHTTGRVHTHLFLGSNVCVGCVLEGRASACHVQLFLQALTCRCNASVLPAKAQP